MHPAPRQFLHAPICFENPFLFLLVVLIFHKYDGSGWNLRECRKQLPQMEKLLDESNDKKKKWVQ